MKARKKSERILKRTAFSKFTNLPSAPVLLDIEEEATNEQAKQSTEKQNKEIIVSAEAGPSEKRKTLEKEICESEAVVAITKRSKKQRAPPAIFGSLRNRCTPGGLISIMECLSDAQKESVRDMGFEPLLKMKLTEVPGQLSYYVLHHFNADTLTIDLPTGRISVNRNSVHDMLGLPLGEIGFETLLPGRDLDDKLYYNWEHQFEKSANIRVQEIKTKIVATEDADMLFRLNFLAIMINSLFESTLMGKCVTQPLTKISNDTLISELDWCSYLIDCLKRTKYSFSKSSGTFVGPCTYLVLVYLDNIRNDCIRVPRTRPAVCHWTSEQVKYRENFEKENFGQFGTGDINPAFDETRAEVISRMFLKKKNSLEQIVGIAVQELPAEQIYRSWKESIDRLNGGGNSGRNVGAGAGNDAEVREEGGSGAGGGENVLPSGVVSGD